MFTLSALLFDNGLPNLPVLLIEPHRNHHGIWRISDETLISLPDFGKGSLSDLRKKLGLPSTDGVRPLSKKR
jgi:hypothetical protein